MAPIIVTLKAFGDFVIACNVAKCLNGLNHNEVKVVAGEHVRELSSVLGVEKEIVFIGAKNVRHVPPIFDIRNAGLLPALKSLFEQRWFLSSIDLGSNFLFDKIGWREKIIGANNNIYGLQNRCGNIYLNYFDFFQRFGFLIPNDDCQSSWRNIKYVTIVPGARMPHRVIPAQVIKGAATELEKRGIDVTVLLLNGENIELPSGVRKLICARRFDALAAEVIKSDLIICADSLPSHLAEFFNIPNFVFTPTPDWSINWLPKSTFKSGGMAKFGDVFHFKKWLDNRLPGG
jgi:hypothetical protein